jgi:thiamine kinase-like enzyme
VTPSSDELRVVLEHLTGSEIADLERVPSPYRTSFPLERLDVGFRDGRRRLVMFKDLGRDALTNGAKAAKPLFLHDPRREIDAYQLLRDTGLEAPECLGFVAEPANGRFWLFLEKVSGVELYQVGELETWQEAARWLARLHAHFAGRNRPLSESFVRYDDAFFRLWPPRAAAQADVQLGRIAARYDRVAGRLTALPTTFVHGEFYASNVLVSRRAEGLRVAPVDWEMAGLGPGLLDVAALSTGWAEAERLVLARSYVAELAEHGAAVPPEPDLIASLDACRLHLALQWLGWSEGWTPPPEHAHDWLAEARDAAERLGL